MITRHTQPLPRQGRRMGKFPREVMEGTTAFLQTEAARLQRQTTRLDVAYLKECSLAECRLTNLFIQYSCAVI